MTTDEYLAEDWDALSDKGRVHYRQVYRSMRCDGEDRQTARGHLAAILHVDRNRAAGSQQAQGLETT